MLADARIAVGFLTRIPVPHDGPLDARALSRAAAWFPAVGLLVGGVLGGVRLLGDLALAPGPATVLALLAAILVTGGFHEDGLADTADGLGAHVGRERKLEILRDSRVGTYGALAVAFALLLPYATLSGLSGEEVLRAALVAHVLGRWSTLPQSLAWPPARTGGSGALVRATPLGTAAATLLAAAVALAAGGLVAGAVALGVAVLVTAGASALLARAFGGVTGDSYGAVNKLVEMSTYLALAAVWA